MAFTVFGISSLQAVGIAVLLGIFYGVYRVVYNLYFHPLATFPGPKHAAISNIHYAIHWTSGLWPFILSELHSKYGPIVRYAPNDLSFATPEAYQEIYGHRKQGEETFVKGLLYVSGPEHTLKGIVSERDPAKHREIRKSLSHAFSAKALRLQTDVVLKYVDMWIEQVRKFGDTEVGINVEEWYNWLTFDIIGDLAFGESFGAVEKAESHPWVVTIKNGLHEAIFHDVFRRVPLLKLWPSLIRPANVVAQRRQQFANSRVRVEHRIQQKTERDDFFSHLLSEKATDTTLEFLTAQANTLIIAGSETTATFLAAATCYLLTNRHTLAHLTDELRSTFSEPTSITSDTTASLPYLHAVISESLRLFPPAPAGIHRISPGAFVSGHFIPAGTTVSVSPWTLTHSSQFFRLPRSFHPERWLPEDHPLYDAAFAGDEREASKPFLLGPRACLGVNLAWLEMRVILARMLWEFELEMVGERVSWLEECKARLLWWKPELRARFRAVGR